MEYKYKDGSLYLGQVFLTAVSCGQNGRAAVREPWRCMDSQTAAHARSAQTPAGHEAAVHNNSHSVNIAHTFCAHSTRRTEAVQKQQLHVTSTYTFGANPASHKTSVNAASCYFTTCMALHYVTFLLSYIHNLPIQTIHNILDHHC